MSRALTLLEVVIVLGLLIVLSGLVMPAMMWRLGSAREERAIRDVESAGLIARAEAQEQGLVVLLAAMPGQDGWRMVSVRSDDGAEKVREWLAADDGLEIGERRRVLVVLPDRCSVRRRDMVSLLPEPEFEGPMPASVDDLPVPVAMFLPDGTAVGLADAVLVVRGAQPRPIEVRGWSGVLSVGAPIQDATDDAGAEDGAEGLAVDRAAVFALLLAARRRGRRTASVLEGLRRTDAQFASAGLSCRLECEQARRRRHRGSVLVEVIVAIAILVMCGVTVIGAIGQATRGFETMRERTQAADLARSAMAKLDAGIASPTTLDGPVPRWVADPDSGAEDLGETPSLGSTEAMSPSGWELEVDVVPSQFTGLSVVTITVVRVEPGLRGEGRVMHTLTQLVRLGSAAEDVAGDEDALLGGPRDGGRRP